MSLPQFLRGEIAKRLEVVAVIAEGQDFAMDERAREEEEGNDD